MAFTCEECRIKEGREHGLGYVMGMGISYGRCESCGKVAECEDLHGYPAKKPSKDKEG